MTEYEVREIRLTPQQVEEVMQRFLDKEGVGDTVIHVYNLSYEGDTHQSNGVMITVSHAVKWWEPKSKGRTTPRVDINPS